MLYLSKDEIAKYLTHSELIAALRDAFKGEITTPERLHFDYANSKAGVDSTLLLMPSWQDSLSLGTKIVTVSPNNGKYDLPSIHGIYVLFDGHTGELQAIMDGKTLTAKRTAAASALACDYLARKDAQSLLMIGTGALCRELIAAHSHIRDLKEIYIWGRSFEKSSEIADDLVSQYPQTTITAIDKIEDKVSTVDIISCATLSKAPLIFGHHVSSGQHYDLVGSFKPDMREADDSFIKKVDVFLDTEMAKKESGDIKTPLDNGVLSESAIKADLFELCRNTKPGRTSNEQTTFFKSVGHGLEDLAAARLVYQQHQNNH
jgi:ornithine cyclodeaminase/alanine dehydrogenase-like protein (mu-crystallin family)